MPKSNLSKILAKHQRLILDDWKNQLQKVYRQSGGRISQAELDEQAERFLDLLKESSERESGSGWSSELENFLVDLSKTRATQGFTSEETALLIFSLKEPLFRAIQQDSNSSIEQFTTAFIDADRELDRIGLFTVNEFQRSREDLIRRQQDELLELSTPVVKLWDGILALPLIGTLDSSRTQVVMESLLQRIVESGSAIAIIDITGVPMVDTMVAQHLLKTVTAIRLMGAECIISGIRPQIAQTIVHLGVELGNVTTKANLADALEIAFERSGLTVRPD